jgi:arylformamidase
VLLQSPARPGHSSRMRLPAPRFHDISLPLRDGGVVYPGDPAVRIGVHLAIARGDPANVSTLALGSHSGTHVDAPSHFLPGGDTVDRLPLGRMVGPAVVVDVSGRAGGIGPEELAEYDLAGRTRVLLRTGNADLLRRGEFSPEYRALNPGGARFLLDRGVELVGVDTLSVERFGSEDFPVHRMLLGEGVVIVEGLDLAGVRAGRYGLVCLPLRLADLDGAPARAVLMEEEGAAV